MVTQAKINRCACDAWSVVYVDNHQMISAVSTREDRTMLVDDDIMDDDADRSFAGFGLLSGWCGTPTFMDMAWHTTSQEGKKIKRL